MRIDPHVHFRDEEQDFKETIAHGLEVAKEQGVDIVFDMPNTSRPILRVRDVRRRLDRVPPEGKGRYFMYIGATSDEDQLREAAFLVNEFKEVVGIKLFAGKSTGDLAIINQEDQKRVYKVLTEANYTGVIAVHCEKEEHMQDHFDPEDPKTHATSRPKIAEIESVKDQVMFARQANFQGTLHICHVSCPESVELIDNARHDMKITCGATPHHLLWDDSMLSGLHGRLYKMNPPLRSKQDVEQLRECLKQNKIDWIETDHAPHTLGEKLHKGFPSGYPSLYLYKSFVEDFLPAIGIDEEQIKNLTSNNIINTFNLETGGTNNGTY
ncbi:dihydroorotase family protein [Nanoarchaeota archaeon]